MKVTLLTLLLTIFLAGCIPAYKPVMDGSRAKLNFQSPTLEGEFLYNIDLDLLIYEANHQCSISPLGKLSLNPGDDPISTYIRADRTAYFKVEYDMVSSYVSFNSHLEFALNIEDNAEYTIEYESKNNQGYYHFYKHDENGKLQPVEAMFWDECKKQISLNTQQP